MPADEAKAYMIRRCAFCAEEEFMFYSCGEPAGSPIKEDLRSILHKKRALFDQQYLMERTETV